MAGKKIFPPYSNTFQQLLKYIGKYHIYPVNATQHSMRLYFAHPPQAKRSSLPKEPRLTKTTPVTTETNPKK